MADVRAQRRSSGCHGAGVTEAVDENSTARLPAHADEGGSRVPDPNATDPGFMAPAAAELTAQPLTAANTRL